MVTFRKFQTLSEKQVLAGKSAENNEELVKQIKPNEIVLHTKAPGSPFCNIKEDVKKISKKDIKEVAVFCAVKSQDWRDNKRNVVVHYFLGKDIYKLKSMKTGTFGVKNTKEITIKRQEILDFIANNETTN
jgi:predicted ribosome quality control (RQC) complex YloA/Tae2 family protein